MIYLSYLNYSILDVYMFNIFPCIQKSGGKIIAIYKSQFIIPNKHWKYCSKAEANFVKARIYMYKQNNEIYLKQIGLNRIYAMIDGND